LDPKDIKVIKFDAGHYNNEAFGKNYQERNRFDVKFGQAGHEGHQIKIQG